MEGCLRFTDMLSTRPGTATPGITVSTPRPKGLNHTKHYQHPDFNNQPTPPLPKPVKQSMKYNIPSDNP